GVRFSSREVLGWLLLLLASEAARREGREDEGLWAAVRRGADGRPRFAEETDRELFVRGRPTRPHREALEAAAQRLHLRHQFGAEGLGDAHASVLLQCGVTRRACRERLYLWLDGRESPETLERLLRGPLASESFADLWAHLYHFRHG